MGVLLLTTLVEKDANILEKRKLQSIRVIIDGNGLLWYILREIQTEDPLSHGGEYESFRLKVTHFFNNLKKCEINAYVVLDGGFVDDKKLNTHQERCQSNIKIASSVLQGCKLDGKKVLKLPLAERLMKQVMTKMDVKYKVSQFEADKDIAVLANQYNCPVIGDDSDFCVMVINQGYIPLNYLSWEKVKITSGGHEMEGRVYRVEKFCESFKVKKELLPLFASLASNDYIESSKVEPFQRHVCGNSTKPSSLDMLKDLLKWLSEQRTCEEASEEALGHLPDVTEELLSYSVGMYSTDGEPSIQSDLSNSEICKKVGAPLWVAEAHQSGYLGSLCINILSKTYCLSSVQVEDFKDESAWMPSESLFAVLCGIILDKRNENKVCTVDVYVRKGMGYEKMVVSAISSGIEELPFLRDIPSLSDRDKQGFLLAILAPGLSSTDELSEVPGDFHLALLGTVYWLNKTKKVLHCASLLIGWIYLYAQRQQNRSDCGSDSDSGRQMVFEFSVVIKNLRHHRRVSERKPEEVDSHGFAQWQQCMEYVLHLSDILQHPLPPRPDICVLYSGILMHSIYATLNQKASGEMLKQRITSKFLHNAPKAYKLFCSMHDFILGQTSQTSASHTSTSQTSASQTSTSQTSTGQASASDAHTPTLPDSDQE